MIEFVYGTDVVRFLDRVSVHIEQYRDVILCSPFIDDDVLRRVEGLARAALEGKCGFGIITAQHSIQRVTTRFTPLTLRRVRLAACPHLHAKFYLAVARKHDLTEAIVTSANLTAGGLKANIELGVRIAGSTPYGRTLLHQIEMFSRRLSFNGRLQWKRL
jgi:hypothetical protein